MNTLARLTEVINARFGASKTIDEYLHRADLLSYEGTKSMFEAFRVSVPRATGIIQWMLNSARPSIYWQLYDYYLHPNAAYYAVKRGNQPVQLIYDYQCHAVFAVNETLQPVTLNAAMRLIAGTTDRQAKTTLTLKPGSIVKAFDVSCATDAFLFLRATDTSDSEIAVNDYFLPAGRRRDAYRKVGTVSEVPVTWPSEGTDTSPFHPSCLRLPHCPPSSGLGLGRDSRWLSSGCNDYVVAWNRAGLEGSLAGSRCCHGSHHALLFRLSTGRGPSV